MAFRGNDWMVGEEKRRLGEYDRPIASPTGAKSSSFTEEDCRDEGEKNYKI